MVIKTAHDWLTLTRDIALLLVTRHLCPRVVVQFHGSQAGRLTDPNQRLFRLASAWLVWLSDGVMVLSLEEQRQWQAFCASREIHVVSNPFVAPPSREAGGALPPHGLPAGVPVVLFVGRLIPEKGVLVLLDAFARLRRTITSHLVVVGEGPQAGEARARASALGVDTSVTFTGYIEGERLASAYHEATVLALPTTWSEGFPTVITEAMHAGLPIVTTRRRGMADHLHEDVNALFVPPDDPAALAAALDRVLGDPALRARMERANREKIREFLPPAVAERYMDVLRAVGRHAHRAAVEG
jgi:glycosyltransferase involved in cell wall biosynthesis